MLIDIEFKEKELQKLVKKINQCYDKKQNEKLLKEAERLRNYLSEGDNLVKILYALSTICEEFEDFLNKGDIKKIKEFASSSNTNVRLNSMSILGMYYLHNQDELLDPKEFESFFDFIKSKDPEIRENALIVLNELSDDFNNLILLHHNDLFRLFLEEKENENNSQILVNLFRRVQKYLPLSVVVQNLAELGSEIGKEKVQWKIPHYRDLLKNFIIDLSQDDEQQQKILGRSEISDIIKNRSPLLKIYDLEEFAKENDSSVTEVEEELKNIEASERIFSFFFTIKNKRYFLELELERFLKILENKKVNIIDVYDVFKKYSIKSNIIVSIIRNLIDEQKIFGYLSPTVFYSDDYLMAEITKEINRNGKLDLGQFKDIDQGYIKDILIELNKLGKNKGVFNQQGNVFLAFKGLQKDLENRVSKESVVDFKEYKKLLKFQDFQELEEYCIKEKLISDFREGTIWLTPVGLIRIMNKLRKEAEIIGIVNIAEISQEFGVPKEIVKDVAINNYKINMKSGLWDKDGERFYYTNYLKNLIKKIETIKDDQVRKDSAEKLSEELNINVDEINRRMNDRSKDIAEKMLKQDIVDIPSFQRSMGMTRIELLDYINRLGRPFLVLENNLILNEGRIDSEKQNVKRELESYMKSNHEIQLKDLSRIFKISDQIISDIFDELLNEGKIKGIKLGKNGFLTETGIQNRILSKRDFFSLYSLFSEVDLKDSEIAHMEEIIQSFIESGQLEGNYDQEQKVFQSNNFSGLELVDSAKSRFSDMIQDYLGFFSNVYDYVRTILMESDLRPSDIDNYRNELERTLRESITWDRNLKKQIYIGQNIYRKFLRNVGSDYTPEVNKFEDFGEVKDKYTDFQSWQTLLDAVDNKAGEIIFLRKKVKHNPKDEESRAKLQEIFDYLSFLD